MASETSVQDHPWVIKDESDFSESKGIGFVAKDVDVLKSEGEDTKIEVPVSGLSEDRDGDRFTENGVNDLVGQINSESIPMFANHGLDSTGFHNYRFEDIMGRWESAEQDGDVVIATATLREGNEHAEQLVDLLEQDMPVGFSVGFGWDEGDAKERDTGGYEFDGSDLMEISPVGIPSNPDAVVQAGAQVATALKSAGVSTETLDADTLTKAIENAMSDEEKETETESEEQESKQWDDDEVAEIMGIVGGVVEAHMDALTEDIRQSLANEDGDTEEESVDETEESDEEEEETREGDDEDDEKEDKIAELEAKIEAMEARQAESAGRKGMRVSEDEESEAKDEETEEVKSGNLLDELQVMED